MIKNGVSFQISSQGATDYKIETSTITQNLGIPVKVPFGANYVRLSIPQVSIWNSVANVDAEQGNFIVFQLPGNPPVTLTFPDGQYSLTDLNTSLSRVLLENGLSADNLTFSEDQPTQKVVFTSDTAGAVVDTPLGSMFKILGLNQGVPLVMPTALVGVLAPNIAAFNNVEAFNLHLPTLLVDGLVLNGESLQVAAKIPITARPSSQIVYEPKVPTEIAVDHLAGASVSTIIAYVTDQSGTRRVNTRENYSFLVSITWYEQSSGESMMF
jgi:hypothetical protein